MGSQQSLLIVLGILVVGTMIVVGFNLFHVSFADQVKDLAIQRVTDIGIRANNYKRIPSASGGGGGSCKGFDSQLSNLLKNDAIVKRFNVSEEGNKIIISLVLIHSGENNRLFRVWATYDSEGVEKLRIYEPDTERWVWLIKGSNNA